MKRTGSLCRRSPYVFSFYYKKDVLTPAYGATFPCMTHAFYVDSLRYASKQVQKLLAIYASLGIYLDSVLEDNLEAIDVDKIVQHYDTQLKLEF